MSLAILRTDLTAFLVAELYTALQPGTAANYPVLGIVQIRGTMVSSSGELGTVQFAPLVPRVTIFPDNPGSVTSIDADFHTELREAATKFWEIYLLEV